MLLIGRDLSPFVRRTAIILETLGLEFERRKLAAIEDAEELAEFTPLGRVPVLVLDDGEKIVDSAVIIDYALEVADPHFHFLPSNGAIRRRILYLSAIATGVMEKGVAVSYERYQRPKNKQYAPWLDRLLNQMRRGMANLEAAASDVQWMQGDRLSLADINAVVLYDFVQLIEPELTLDAAPCALPVLSGRLNRTSAFINNRYVRPAK